MKSSYAAQGESAIHFLERGGAMGARMRAFNWASTPWGRPERWPARLQTLLTVLLASEQPMLLIWSSEEPGHRICFENDACAALADARLPGRDGRSLAQRWSAMPGDAGTADATAESLLERAFDGRPMHNEKTQVTVRREGDIEPTRYSFSYTSLRNAAGEVDALLGTGIEMPRQFAAQRATLQQEFDHQMDALFLRYADLQDTKERLAATNAQLESTNRLIRHVIDMVPARISYWTADLRCRFANRAFADWVGCTIDNVLGQTAERLFGAERIRQVQPHIDGAFAGVAQRFERQAARGDGGFDYNRIDYVPEPTAPGQAVPAIYLMAVDITELKTTQESLKAANEELQRSRDQARRASRAKSAFLADMSHEIRTPLNAILGLTHILSRRLADTEHREQLGKVDVAARHLLNLISDVLDLSKVEAGKLVLERHGFETSDVIERVIEMVRGMAAAKGLPIIDETAGLPRSVCGDSLRLSQILLNLLSNAVKFTDEGCVRLRGELMETRGRRHLLRFEVHDTGPGIDPAHQSSLFGSFEQGDTSISRRHGGTGLGLALSRQLARAMGGDAGLESAPGAGSMFWFTAWLEEADRVAIDDSTWHESDSSGSPEQIAELEAQLRTLHPGQRVLLVEDNPVNIEVGLAMLEAVGLQVDCAADGEEAVAQANTGRFDLVLMDMQMPRLDGLQATRAIRAGLWHMPIIAMTANAFVDDRHACIEAGMDDYIAKPVEPLILYSMLLQWLPSRSKPGRSPLTAR